MQFFPEAPRRAFRETPPKNVLLDTSRCDVTLAMGGQGGAGGLSHKSQVRRMTFQSAASTPEQRKRKLKLH